MTDLPRLEPRQPRRSLEDHRQRRFLWLMARWPILTAATYAALAAVILGG